MLRNDNDFGLWQSIRDHKNQDRKPATPNDKLYDQVYDVYRFLGRSILVALHGHQVWTACRWLHKCWYKLFTKQDSK